MKMKEREEAEAMAEQEATQREKRPKVKKPKVEFPVYEPSSESLYQTYEQETSIEEIEDQMDDWLEERRAGKRKQTAEWTEDELSLLSRLMVKFPGGTPGRWEKIAHELGRSVSEVTTKVKQVKESVSNASGLVKLAELKGSSPPSRSPSVPDSLMTQREGGGRGEEEEEEEEEEGAAGVRRRNRKAGEGGEARVKGRRQRDFDPAEEEEPSVWTQNQQKLLEVALQQNPRGTTERWDRIAKGVPGRTKEECMIRYKLLAELVQKRKQAKS
ncbi:dnaJ homolog subfamily C member 1-like [Centroberyx affinis]|uniref:dnaJ homolog subfamily C member 1-like n=1 Tax=Centroberyx affinis TaxID=166261 RepID=UPI003A5BE16F